MRLQKTILIAVLVLLLIVTGCATKVQQTKVQKTAADTRPAPKNYTENEYEDKIAGILIRIEDNLILFKDTLNAVNKEFSGKKITEDVKNEIGRKISQPNNNFREIRSELGSIAPPEKYHEFHDKIKYVADKMKAVTSVRIQLLSGGYYVVPNYGTTEQHSEYLTEALDDFYDLLPEYKKLVNQTEGSE